MAEPLAKTVLITAGAYVGSELAAEFGRLPPSFLPVGNRRLFVHQHEQLAPHFSRMLMSVPSDLVPEQHDRALLEEAGIELIFVPRGLDLPTSILHAMAEAGVETGPLAILHGDTLIYDIDFSLTDAVSLAETSASYDWAGCTVADERVTSVFDLPQGGASQGPVLSGFFHFDDINLLVLSLATSRGRFVDALDRYVRQRPMQPLVSERWLDFGHLHTYYRSRGLITTEREFNALSVQSRSIAKSSSKRERIEAEAHWYESVPPSLRIFLPQYLGRSDGPEGQSYALEFLYMASLADLFVFGTLPRQTWHRIFLSCADFLAAGAGHTAAAVDTEGAMGLYLPKTLARLDDFAAASGIDLDREWTINGVRTPSLSRIATLCADHITEPEPRHLTVTHGDFCFSNILFDSGANRSG
jgi:hypothetical protein